jgi:uncharacterized pyridoxamine 5'-phosphate oxidase family protein
MAMETLYAGKRKSKMSWSTDYQQTQKKRRSNMTRDEVTEYIKKMHIGYLATVSPDNSPRVRPISIHTIYDRDIYFFTFSTTRKCAEMEANPQVEVVWSNLADLYQVRIRGNAAVVEDKAVQQRFKDDDPKVGQMLPPGTEKLFRLYKLQPGTVEAAERLVAYREVAW